jgi:uncharacterized protein YbjT (DUF2867 family)
LDITTAPAPRPATALLLGATGLIGGHVLDLLLADPAYGRITVLGRRPVPREHPKLEQHVADLGRLEEHADRFNVDAVFCCLGTTIKVAGSQEAFRRVDYEYVASSARMAAEHGARRYLLVTAGGADAGSRIFYSRTKGEAEDAVRALPLPSTVILRPSLLLGERAEPRPIEAMAQRWSSAINRMMIGPLRRYRPIEARTVARAMVRLAAQNASGVRIVENEEIQEIGE